MMISGGIKRGQMALYMAASPPSISVYRITNVDIGDDMQISGTFTLHQLETIVKHVPSVSLCSVFSFNALLNNHNTFHQAFTKDIKYRSYYIVYPKSDHSKMITILSLWLSIPETKTDKWYGIK
jgi:hypothetical protein